MFELRWLKYKTGFGSNRKIEKKLQFRVITNPIETGLQEPIWSDWEDVETVMDDSCMAEEFY